jgi:hypothetical protein
VRILLLIAALSVGLMASSQVFAENAAPQKKATPSNGGCRPRDSYCCRTLANRVGMGGTVSHSLGYEPYGRCMGGTYRD